MTEYAVDERWQAAARRAQAKVGGRRWTVISEAAQEKAINAELAAMGVNVLISRPGDREDKPVLIELRCTEDDLALLKSHAPENDVELWWRQLLAHLRLHRLNSGLSTPYTVEVERLAQVIWEQFGPPPDAGKRPTMTVFSGTDAPELVDVSGYTWEQLRELGGESGGPYGCMLMRARELLREASR